MTGPVCFNLQERLLPYLRAETARALAAKGLRQERIAEHLCVSQAMVSKYVRKPVRRVEGVLAEATDPLVASAVARALNDEARGGIGAHCALCTGLAQAGHATATRTFQEVDQCLRNDRPVSRADQHAVLTALAGAERRLRAASPTQLQPEVRMNLAMCLANAQDTRDVAAFPGRLVGVEGRLAAVSEPSFGSSRHLASVLLRVRTQWPTIHAILNLRWDAKVEQAAGRARLHVHRLTRQAGELQFSWPAGRKRIHALADPGDFGIEPALYVMGKDAQEAVARTLRLQKALSPNIEANA